MRLSVVFTTFSVNVYMFSYRIMTFDLGMLSQTLLGVCNTHSASYDFYKIQKFLNYEISILKSCFFLNSFTQVAVMYKELHIINVNNLMSLDIWEHP